VNFHGATLPRGWERTYPNLMTMEAVRGLEFVTFEQRNADAEPVHAAMLPFARNVFDPMDFTPVVIDKIRNIERRTSSAFELALSVLFTSGIQHYAEIPDGMAKAPEYVQQFLREVPASWDDVKFIDGFSRAIHGARAPRRQAVVDRGHQRGSRAEKSEARSRRAGRPWPRLDDHRRHRRAGFQERDVSARSSGPVRRDRNARPRRVRRDPGRALTTWPARSRSR
jgi:hypothetical protein